MTNKCAVPSCNTPTPNRLCKLCTLKDLLDAVMGKRRDPVTTDPRPADMMDRTDLYTRTGAFVHSIRVPAMRPRPEIIQWGSRYFVFDTASGRYLEGVMWVDPQSLGYRDQSTPYPLRSLTVPAPECSQCHKPVHQAGNTSYTDTTGRLWCAFCWTLKRGNGTTGGTVGYAESGVSSGPRWAHIISCNGCKESIDINKGDGVFQTARGNSYCEYCQRNNVHLQAGA